MDIKKLGIYQIYCVISEFVCQFYLYYINRNSQISAGKIPLSFSTYSPKYSKYILRKERKEKLEKIFLSQK